MTRRLVVVGGGAAGIGAAGAAKQTDPDLEPLVFTEYEDAAYSPCGIPYVHGREIDSFERPFLQGKEHYEEMGIHIRYETLVTSIDLRTREVTVLPRDDLAFDTRRHAELLEQVRGRGERVPFDHLVVATGFDYQDPGIPGSDLQGLYFVKNIRRAAEWDEVLDKAKVAVVQEASPLGLEMVTALAHRGIETHLVDPRPWALAEFADPDIMQPVEDSWSEMGVKMHYNTRVEAYVGHGTIRAVATSEGELPADLVVVCTHKRPNNVLAREAGLKIGSTGGIVVDERMATSADGVWAAGDCVEVPHELTRLPLQGLSGSHAYAQGKVAGTSAAGGDRTYRPVYVPWGMVAGKWMIGGVSFGETTAEALGMPYALGVAEGISRARYYPDMKKIRVKLLCDPSSLQLLGAQMVGGEGI
ncbi:MAG TPA: FAD-dependent oxidoreductase, partial [Actinomycetota bacterium]|nr:FAD-dependent oxidoreductase [Actinomycetota bacterium]